MTPAEASDIRQKLHAGGFSPVPLFSFDYDKIPPGDRGKRPLGRKWQEEARQPRPFCIDHPVPHALSTGILADELRAVDLDIDDPPVSATCRALIVKRLGDTITRTRDNSPRCLLVYRAAKGSPAKITLAGTRGKIEILGHGQQFQAHDRHQSGALLVWSPASPWQIPRHHLPAVTEEQIAALLNELAPIIGAEPPRPATSTGNGDADPGDADTLVLASAMAYIPNAGPADWEAWNRWGMALWAATGGSAQGFSIWDGWSSRNPAYNAKTTRERWEHYAKSPPDRTGRFKIFREARRQGWKPPTGWIEPEPEPEPIPEPPPWPEEVPPPPPFTLAFGSEIEKATATGTIVRGILHAGSVSLFYGQPKSGKSFLTTDLFVSIAACQPDWIGHDIVRPGPVLYVACEGHGGYWKRFRAKRLAMGWQQLPVGFGLARARPRLIRFDATSRVYVPDASEILAMVAAATARGYPPLAVCIDTVFRSFGVANVNASDHMNIYLTALTPLLDQNIAVALVHHETKSGGTPAGSVTLVGSCDTVVHVKLDGEGKEKKRSWYVEMAKDDSDTEPRAFSLEVIDVGYDADDYAASSCVIHDDGAALPKAKPGRPANMAERDLVLQFLRDAITEHGTPQKGAPDAVEVKHWRELFYLKARPDDSPEAKKKAFQRMVRELQGQQKIAVAGTLVWPLGLQPGVV